MAAFFIHDERELKSLPIRKSGSRIIIRCMVDPGVCIRALDMDLVKGQTKTIEFKSKKKLRQISDLLRGTIRKGYVKVFAFDPPAVRTTTRPPSEEGVKEKLKRAWQTTTKTVRYKGHAFPTKAKAYEVEDDPSRDSDEPLPQPSIERKFDDDKEHVNKSTGRVIFNQRKRPD